MRSAEDLIGKQYEGNDSIASWYWPASVDRQLAPENYEACQALLSLVGNKAVPIPAAIIATHVFSVSADFDWPVRHAALEAVLKRIRNAKREELKIRKRPEQRLRLGIYQVSSSKAARVPKYWDNSRLEQTR